MIISDKTLQYIENRKRSRNGNIVRDHQLPLEMVRAGERIDSGPIPGKAGQEAPRRMIKRGRGRPPGGGKSKLESHKAEIQALLALGMTQGRLAERLGTAQSNLCTWMKTRGIKKPKRTRRSKLDPHKAEIQELLGQGITQKRVAEGLGTTSATFSRWMKSRKIKRGGPGESKLDSHEAEIRRSKVPVDRKKSRDGNIVQDRQLPLEMIRPPERVDPGPVSCQTDQEAPHGTIKVSIVGRHQYCDADVAGERKMWVSCFTEAIKDLAMKAPGNRIERLRYRDEALRWFQFPEDKGVGSFSWICSVLNFNEELTRERILSNPESIEVPEE